jgi:hypothetical protein
MNSSRCFFVSPIPMIPPVQSSNPACLAIFSVFILSSNVCVVQISGNFVLDVSKLWLYRLTFSNFNFFACSMVRKPRLHSKLIPTLELISSIISQTVWKSSSEGSRHAATKQKESAPLFFAVLAWSTISSAGWSL